MHSLHIAILLQRVRLVSRSNPTNLGKLDGNGRRVAHDGLHAQSPVYWFNVIYACTSRGRCCRRGRRRLNDVDLGYVIRLDATATARPESKRVFVGIRGVLEQIERKTERKCEVVRAVLRK